MKDRRKNVIAMGIFALLLSGAFVRSINAQRQSSDTAAICSLRETGDYNPLEAAFEATGQTNGDISSRPDEANVEHIKLSADNNAFNSRFGSSLAISGNTAVVGDFNSNGSVSIFVKSGNGVWTLQQKLAVADSGGDNDDHFGVSVAISGDTLFVGAELDDSSSILNQGAVYVFTRNGTLWTQQQKLTAPDAAENKGFGQSIGISGDSLVIGSDTPNFQGAAHIFVRSGSIWLHQQKLTASDGVGSDLFGNSVAISGNSVIVGALLDDIGSNTNRGSAYIFTRSGTTWTEQRKLLAADGAAGDFFGQSVGISDNTAIVGAHYHDVNGKPNQGAAYIFVRSGTTWSDEQKISAVDGSPGGNFFGYSVAISGDMVIVGASLEDVALFDNRGAAHVFTRSGTAWTRQYRLFAADGAANDNLGISVAMESSVWLAGAPDGNNRRGLAYIFDANFHRTPLDFDGDSKTDISVFRPATGIWYLDQSSNGFTGIAFGQNGDKLAPADYDGDGKIDVAVYRPSNGTWYLQRSQLGFTGLAFGTAEDIPVPADYDADGKDDIALFRPSTGVWYLQRSTAGFAGLGFGQAGDVPVPADYDGDGKTDLAVIRAGVWRIQRSLLGTTSISFGETTDKPVPADYDGDGKADVAVFRPSTGIWYLQRSQAGFTGIQFGQTGDLPVPADYDGDGKADIAVFRNGTWYLSRSTSGFTGTTFGAATDLPVPSAFIQ